MDMDDVSAKRKKLLRELGLTQFDIQKALNGMSHVTVGKYFNNRRLSRRSKADIDELLEKLRLERNNPEDGGPEAA